MKIDEKFNKRGTSLINTAMPVIHGAPQYALGICATFYAAADDDSRSLSLHMTPTDAMQFAEDLLATARRLVVDDPRVLRNRDGNDACDSA